jgi:DUF1680 family protein
MAKIARRDFLKAAPAAASVVAYASRAGATADAPAQTGNAPQSADPKIGAAAYVPVRDYPIRPKPYFDVTLADGFWKPRIATNAAVTIPLEVQKLTAAPRGLTGNVLEAAILSLKTHPNARLRAIVDARLQQLAEAPESGNNGFEVAATLYQTTGRTDLLNAAERAADALYADFVAHNPPFSGGERDAINCVQLYRATHDKKHLDLARHYLDIRGLPNSVNRSRHNQSYKPVLEQSEAVGHAVNGASLMVSLVDVGVLTGVHDYFDAAHRMWLDIVGRKLYITGGVGTTGNEGFGEGYSLPNISAYSETCAALMFITLNHRLFLATGDSQYIDVMERSMYNNAVAGVSSAGDRFFYVNRLASAGDGRDARWERASLECCPPNLVRFLASMPGFIYGQDQQDRIYVNLYVTSETTFKTGRGEIRLSVQSEMPWSGQSTITVSAGTATAGSILLRIPGWSRNLPAPGGLYAYAESIDRPVTVAVNGTSVSAVPDTSGYVVLEREWKDGDTIRIEFPIEVRRVVADRRVVQNHGRMAVERGPIVYCSEWPDTEGGRVLDRLFDRNGPLTPSVDRSLYGGVTMIDAEARSISNPSSPGRRVRLIPYSLWANRGPGEMSVWLSTAGYTIGDIGPAGGFIFYENPNYAQDGWRYLEAAPFDQSAGAKWGCFRRAIAGAHGTAIGTGRQNTLDMKANCTEPGSASDLCARLTVNGVGGWFLPARDELALMYRNLKVAGLGDFHDGGVADNFSYWTSSQQTADMAAHIDFADLGRQHGDDKDFPRRVRAIRTV